MEPFFFFFFFLPGRTCLMFTCVLPRYVASSLMIKPRPFGGRWQRQWTGARRYWVKVCAFSGVTSSGSLEKGCWKAKLYVHHSRKCKSMAWSMLGPVSSPEMSAGLWPPLPCGSVSEKKKKKNRGAFNPFTAMTSFENDQQKCEICNS